MPFCVRKCNYCDFLSGPFDDGVKKAYLDSLIKELHSYADLLGKREISTIYIGGGTPSCLPSSHIRKIIEDIKGMSELSKDCEISMEINPGSADEKKLEDYLDAGINRFSIGLQSVHEKELKALGRIHSYADFEALYDLMRRMGACNINVDLMTGIPFESRDSALESLETVAALKPEHISVYSLIIEPGTAFYEKSPEELALPDEDEENFIYEMTEKVLEKSAYHRYEISNYAREGFECRHNLVYWDCGDYLGLGAGAASRIGRRRFSNIRDVSAYISRPIGNLAEDLYLEDKDYMAEFMFMGLRKISGISMKDFALRFGADISDIYGEVMKRHEKAGMTLRQGDRYCLSKRGMDLSNIILADYIF